ncbi:sugar phosphate isomerase/epimerase [Limnohabitans sp. B9-3]|uniref:sugar phosphate isomerase/epimerase family protein n=1 Tax=Limnohabitans sp. B9-3 TaxID=1100707 RepID=UPI000C1E19C9|nr:TIM barrel protein [Limnohabitans sp. B9-3]PIT77545.1 xylose isomerase [Limnohabitans sp. B9-3]
MRTYSLAYLTANASTVPEAISIAAQLGYGFVGLRLQPNGPGAPFQSFITDAAVQRETLVRMADTGVQVFDLEIIRIGEQFDPVVHRPLLEAGAALKARAVLIAADDSNEQRLAQHYAQLCEFMQPYGLTADLEFMPWTGVKDTQAAMRVVKQAGTPKNAGILVDALHFGRSTTTLADIAAIPRKLLHYAQMCDAQAGLSFTTEELIHSARQERLLPGEGTIDVKGLFATLPQDLPVSVEIVNLERSKPIGDKAWAEMCLNATQKVLGDA